MDLLSPASGIELNDPSWKIYSRSPSAAPQFISDKAKVSTAMIAEGCVIEGTVDFSVLFDNVTVEEGALVRDSVVMPGTVIKSGATVQYAIVAENSVIGENAVIGARPEDGNKDDWGICVIGEGVSVAKGATVPANTMIENDVKEEA